MKKTFFRRYATPLIAIPFGLFILGFGGIRDGFTFGYILGGVLIAWGISSFFTNDTEKLK